MQSPTILSVPVAGIAVGERRRDEYGAVDELAHSIATYGLLHPIVVDEDNNLVAGGRRLAAVTALGWEQIPARLLGTLTQAERREIELEENLQRKDLTSYELDKHLVSLAETAAEALREPRVIVAVTPPPAVPSEPQSEDAAFYSVEDHPEEIFVRNSERKSRGRPSKPDSTRKVADRIGRRPSEIVEARQRVEISEAFPIFQKPDWKQYHVLQAREAIEKLPEAERMEAVAVVDNPRIAPQTAIELLGNIAHKPEEERQTIYDLNRSEDARYRSLALTKAGNTPQMPDPRLELLDQVLDKLRAATKPFPDDPLTPRLRVIRSEVKVIRAEVSAVSFDVRRGIEGETE